MNASNSWGVTSQLMQSNQHFVRHCVKIYTCTEVGGLGTEGTPIKVHY